MAVKWLAANFCILANVISSETNSSPVLNTRTNVFSPRSSNNFLAFMSTPPRQPAAEQPTGQRPRPRGDDRLGRRQLELPSVPPGRRLAPAEGHLQYFHQVQRFAVCSLFDLLPATEAVGDDERVVARLAHRRQRPVLADLL